MILHVKMEQAEDGRLVFECLIVSHKVGLKRRP